MLMRCDASGDGDLQAMMPNTIQKLTVSLFHLTCDIDDQFPSAPHWGTSHAVDVQDEARPLMPMRCDACGDGDPQAMIPNTI